MTTRKLPTIGIGTYDMEPAACTTAVTTALETGYRHVDTAEMYGTEEAVGRAINEASIAREDVFVATKIQSRHLSYEAVLEHTRECKNRLDVETIDLLYIHWPIRTYDPSETLAAFDELYEEDEIRHVGVSNFTPALLEEAIDLLEAPLFAHQVECHPLLPQDKLRRYARQEGHHLVAYSPLAKGEVLEVPELIEIGDKYEASPVQISLAWLLSKDNVVPIPKSTTPIHIEENYHALDLELHPQDIELIDSIDRRERMVDFPDAPWNTEASH